jgi:predicted RNA-binding protein YlxR (DUF448 family)
MQDTRTVTRTCARCSESGPANRYLRSRPTGAFYCRDYAACTRRVEAARQPDRTGRCRYCGVYVSPNAAVCRQHSRLPLIERRLRGDAPYPVSS